VKTVTNAEVVPLEPLKLKLSCSHRHLQSLLETTDVAAISTYGSNLCLVDFL
jgi:hypothetical protein